MSKIPIILAAAILCTSFWTHTLRGDVYQPEVLSGGQVANEEPYIFNGIVRVPYDSFEYYGSGYAVLPHTVITAAHVIFDDTALNWRVNIRWHSQYNHNSTPSSGRFMRSEVWTSYAARVEDDPAPEGTSSLDTFNVDTAAIYSTSHVVDSSIGRIMKISEKTINPYLTSNRNKMFVGYPLDEIHIPYNNWFRMHRTSPANYTFTKFPNEDFDSFGTPWRLYVTNSATTYGGNSGGPVYALFEDGKWYPIATILGTDDGDTLVRATDDEVALLAHHAEFKAGGSGWTGSPILLEQPKDLPLFRGDRATFTVTPTGEAPFTYQWKKNEEDIPGATSDTLILESALDGDEGVYTVEVTNNQGTLTSQPAILTILEPPEISITPVSYTLTVGYRENTTQTLSISNLNEGLLEWDVGYADENGTPLLSELEDMLEKLDEEHTLLTALIPNRYDFSEGVTGSVIFEGGESMYHVGNRLTTNISTFYIPYSDGVITYDDRYGSEPRGRYFTRKYPGLFMLAADTSSIETFEINGDLGVRGIGPVDGSVLKATRGGQPYRAFVNRVFGTDEPSVNHLIIVPERYEINHEFSPLADVELHRIYNLENTKRLIYLLYSGIDGTYIDDETTQALFETLLEIINPELPWLSISPNAGTTALGETDEVLLHFDTSELLAGTYETTLVVASNDPANRKTLIPVTLNIREPDPPDIAVEPTSLDFGELTAGSRKQLNLTVTNEGEDYLRINSVSGTLPDFVVEDFEEIVLDSGESRTVPVTYTPITPGNISGTLTLFSDDPDTPEFDIDVSGFGYVPDSSVSQPDISVSLRLDETNTTTIQLANDGNGPLKWVLLARDPRGYSITRPLESSLQGLIEHHKIISSAIPNIHALEGGTEGSSIIDGGNHAFDEGNIISTDLANALPYSDNLAIDDTSFGTEGRYMTLKLPGLWVLAADLDDVERFEISGNLGADSAGTADGSVLRATVNQTTYKGFVKRVHGAGGPSVNHLIIVPNDPDITHSFSSDTDSDFHQIQNLGNTRRLYYLMFAGENGQRYDDEVMLQVMKRFLYALRPGTSWVTVETVEGVLEPSETQPLIVHIDPTGLSQGFHNTQLILYSNDPEQEIRVISVHLDALPTLPPGVSVSPTSFSLELGRSEQEDRELTIYNNGPGILTWEISPVSSHPNPIPTWISVEPMSGIQNPSETQYVTVSFNTDDLSAGVYEANLELETDDPNQSILIVPVQLTVTPELTIDIAVSPESISLEMYANDNTNRILSIQNTGTATLNWQLRMNDYPEGTYPDWLRIFTESGAVGPSETQIVTLRFETDFLSLGEYEAELIIESNAPDKPSLTIPLNLAIIPRPPPEVSIDPLSFSVKYYDGGPLYQQTLIIQNTGEDDLNWEISAETIPPWINIYTESGLIEPSASKIVGIHLNPSGLPLGEYEAMLELNTNDPNNPTLTIPVKLSVIVPKPPELTINPQSLQITLSEDMQAEQTITLGNAGDIVLRVERIYPVAVESESMLPLEDVMYQVKYNSDTMLEQLPDHFNFRGGEGGYSIDQDIYDDGNYVGTNLSHLDNGLNYTQYYDKEYSSVGEEGNYFTRKVGGLWVFAANLDGVNQFKIWGDLAANGNGTTDGSIIQTTFNGIEYKGFIKRVFGAGNPSVNHLVIILDNPDATHVFSSDTNSDEHVIGGLKDKQRLYYLLFSGKNGVRYDDETILNFMKSFIHLTRRNPRWLKAEPINSILEPEETQIIRVRYDSTDLPVGEYEAKLVFHSNDHEADYKTADVNLTIVPPPPPEVSISPPSLSTYLTEGDASSSLLTLRNTDSSPLNWQISPVDPNGSTTIKLEDVLLNLVEKQTLITDKIPLHHNFSGGETGIRIVNNDIMYKSYGGNELNTSSRTSIPYSNGILMESSAFGSGSRYFTLKVPGLWVMAADANNLEEFFVAGGLAQYGKGTVDGTELETAAGGTVYTGYIKQAYGSGYPSVCHIIIIPKQPDLVLHSYSKLGIYDGQGLEIIEGVNRLYYLLFSERDGRRYPDETMLEIMETFLHAVLKPRPSWLSIEPTYGTLNPWEEQTLTAHFNAAELSIGEHAAALELITNDPNQLPKTLPIELVVLPQQTAYASLSPAHLDFGNVQVGESKVLSFTVNPQTTETAYTLGYNLEGTAFDTEDPVGVTIEPGRDADFQVSFTPQLPGKAWGYLTINLALPEFAQVRVLLEGRGTLSLGERVANWRDEYFASDQNNPSQEESVWGDRANPDGDSLPNLIEFYMGLDPKAKDDGEAWKFEERADGVRFTYRRSKSASDDMCALEYSYDLINWTSANVTENVAADMGDHVVVEASVPTSEGDKVVFVRLKVTGDME